MSLMHTHIPMRRVGVRQDLLASITLVDQHNSAWGNILLIPVRLSVRLWSVAWP